MLVFGKQFKLMVKYKENYQINLKNLQMYMSTMNLVWLVNGCYSSPVKQKRLNADFLKVGRQVFHSL